MKTFNSGLKLISLFGFLTLFASTAFALENTKYEWVPYEGPECREWRPPEVSTGNRVKWEIDGRSLINLFYDTDKNGKVDFITVYRQSPQDYGYSTPSTTPEEMKKRFPKNIVISTKVDVVLKENTDYIPSPAVGVVESREEYGKTRYEHYLLNNNPFYYVLDRDEDGRHDIVYKDREEDGINGNETLDQCIKEGEQEIFIIQDESKEEFEIKWKSSDQAVIDGAKIYEIK